MLKKGNTKKGYPTIYQLKQITCFSLNSSCILLLYKHNNCCLNLMDDKENKDYHTDRYTYIKSFFVYIKLYHKNTLCFLYSNG